MRMRRGERDVRACGGGGRRRGILGREREREREGLEGRGEAGGRCYRGRICCGKVALLGWIGKGRIGRFGVLSLGDADGDDVLEKVDGGEEVEGSGRVKGGLTGLIDRSIDA